MTQKLTPWLSVTDGQRALSWYADAFGAVDRNRLDDDQGRAIVARLAIGDAEFWFGEDPGGEDAGGDAGGGPIRLILTVEDPDAVFAHAVAAGATEVFPVSEEHGWRVGRLADPFGHHWEIGTELG